MYRIDTNVVSQPRRPMQDGVRLAAAFERGLGERIVRWLAMHSPGRLLDEVAHLLIAERRLYDVDDRLAHFAADPIAMHHRDLKGFHWLSLRMVHEA